MLNIGNIVKKYKKFKENNNSYKKFENYFDYNSNNEADSFVALKLIFTYLITSFLFYHIIIKFIGQKYSIITLCIYFVLSFVMLKNLSKE